MDIRRTLTALWLTPLGLAAPAGAQARYDLDVRLRPAVRGVDVRGTVTLAPSPQARDSITLLLSSWMKDVHFDAPGTTLGQHTDGADGDRSWRLVPARAFPASLPITVRFTYRADSLTAPQLRVDSVGAVFGGGGEIWYPRLAFDSLATGTLAIHVPPGHTAVAPGDLTGDASRHMLGEFRFDIRESTLFAFAVRRYRVVRTHAGSVPVALYVRPGRMNADSLANRVATVLSALTGTFGPLPYKGYAVAEVDFGGSVAGTSEFGFFMADSREMDRGLSVTFIGHEIGHAWWGNLVRTQPGPGRMMLTEGIASFGMARALRAVEGDSALERLRKSVYPTEQLRGSPEGYFRLAAAGLEMPLTSVAPRGQLELLQMHRMANTRGWFAYDMLAREVGEARFMAFLSQIIAEFRGKAVAWTQFRDRAVATFGPTADRFISQWLDRGGAPELALRWTQSGNDVVGTIEQTSQPVFDVRVLVRVSSDAGVDDVMVRAADASTAFRVPVSGRATAVTLDPDYLVLRWTPALRRRAESMAQATRIEWLRLYGSRDSAVAEYRRAIESGHASVDTLGAAFELHYQGAQALLAKADTAGALQAFADAAAQAVRDAQKLPRVYLSIARIAAAQDHARAAREAAAKALAADAVAGGATGVRAEAQQILGLPDR